MSIIKARMAKREAQEWIRQNYDVPAEEAYRNMLEYIFRGSPRMALQISALELFYGKDYYDEVAHTIHEMVEASEIKKKFGYIAFKKAFHDYAHPIATKYELRYLEDVGRRDLIEEVRKREESRS